MTDVDDVVPLASKGTGVEGRSVNEILVAGQDSAEGGFLDEILVAGQNPADEGICISRVTVATVGRDVVIVPDNPDGSIRVVQDGLGVVLGKYSVEQICDAQSKDPEFKWLTEWLDDNSCQPAQGDLFRSSPPAKFYWTIKERFSRDERGMIMYHAKDGEGNRLLVPREWRRDIMELCHDIPSAGHQGMTRTQERVKQFYYWHGLKKDLEGYVACNQSKKPKNTARCVGISPQEAEEWENQDYICSGCNIQNSKPDPPQASLNPTGLRRCPVTRVLEAARRGVGLPRRRGKRKAPGDDTEIGSPSVERDTPSLRDRYQGPGGEAEVPGEAISGDHRDPSPKGGDTSLEWGSGAVTRSTRDGSPNSRERARLGSREGAVRDPSGGRSRCSVSRSTPGAAVPMARDTPVGIPADRDAHSAPPLGRGFQVKKETTQERKRRNRQKERLAEETARLQSALRDAQERRTPQSASRGMERVSAHSNREQGGRLGCRGKRHRNAATQKRGQGCQDRGHPRTVIHKGRLGCRAEDTPRKLYGKGDWGVRIEDTPGQLYSEGDWGVRPENTPRKLYGKGDWGVKPKDTPTRLYTEGERPPHPAKVPHPGLPHKGVRYSATCDAGACG
ncbi:unnamed protein product [Mytilus coruscus]|uniref:Integrase zinc-binding domain-containing protein n=1 Tax=Mytilus coruscus TaxID=42192 RepID=A0A6J8C6I7_MYTCO|nr:unnamed protein product [Mytilus coruscus]